MTRSKRIDDRIKTKQISQPPMSKRKREAIKKAAKSKIITNDADSRSLHNDESRQSQWRKLSLQGKLLTVLTIGLLSLSALGAGWKYLDDNAKQTMAQR